MSVQISKRSMFEIKVIDRFLHPFKELIEQPVLKISIIITAIMAEGSGWLSGMFDTPAGYAKTMLFLILADSASRSIRIVFRDKSRDWDFAAMLRGLLYKIGSYGLVLFGATIWDNQWGTGEQEVIYSVYAGLGALEVISIMRHQKVFGWLRAFWKAITGRISAEKLEEAAEEHAMNEFDST